MTAQFSRAIEKLGKIFYEFCVNKTYFCAIELLVGPSMGR